MVKDKVKVLFIYSHIYIYIHVYIYIYILVYMYIYIYIYYIIILYFIIIVGSQFEMKNNICEVTTLKCAHPPGT